MTPRILVTGAGGFVGGHLLSCLQAFRDKAEILATSRSSSIHPEFGVIEQMRVTDEVAVGGIMRRFRPTHVIHLAGMAAVPAANAQPDAAWQLHLFGTLNVAQAIMHYVPEAFLVHVGSGQVYGSSAERGEPLDESCVLAPTDTYTSSKASADLALGAMARHGLKCIRFRPFNHIGPGQSEDFVVSSFAMQVARIKQGRQRPILQVGNLSVQRDFVDVRDIAAAYAKAITASNHIVPGTILNLASGRATPVEFVLAALMKFADINVQIVPDPSRTRAREVASYVGNADKAKEVLGWLPTYRLEDTLRESFDSAMDKVRNEFPKFRNVRD